MPGYPHLDALHALGDISDRLERFREDLRAQGVHVGVNYRCVSCREPFPCSAIELRLPDHLEAVGQAVDQAIRLGWMEPAGVDDDGTQLYRMTAAGEAYVEAMGGA
ncbi:MAG TPA: hypothetical protein VGX21_13225 [Methylomirabilota bacterium]|jgi:hypothetical protein|nr:hypothetical protein [Methylomirabilota bacterium]